MAGHGWVTMQLRVPEQGSPVWSWCVASPRLVEAEEMISTAKVFGEQDAVFACCSVQPSFAAAVSHHPEAEEAQVPSSCPSCSSSHTILPRNSTQRTSKLRSAVQSTRLPKGM